MSKKKRVRKGKNSRAGDPRRDKMTTQRKMKGWQTTNKDWEHHAFNNLDRLWEDSGKDSHLPTNNKLRARINDIFLERIDLYKEVAELTRTRLTNGEMVWAIQRDIGYNQELYKYNEDELEESVLRDLRVHSLKYVIECVYNRDGFGDYETVKQSVYQSDLPTDLPATHFDVEEWLLKELQEFVNKVKEKQAQLEQ